MIALLCPTRERPEQCRRMIDSAYKTSSSPLSVILSVQGELDGYEKLRLQRHIYDLSMDYEPTVYRWNRMAMEKIKRPEPKLFMLAADDIIFSTPCWDEALINHYNSLENKIHVYALQDSRDADGTPHPIVTREYIDAMGYFMPPIFLHWFIDTWTVEIAKANGCFTHLKNYELIHDKPSDKGLADETHNRIRRMGWHERDSYVNQICQHFLAAEKRRLCDVMEAKAAA